MYSWRHILSNTATWCERRRLDLDASADSFFPQTRLARFRVWLIADVSAEAPSAISVTQKASHYDRLPKSDAITLTQPRRLCAWNVTGQWRLIGDGNVQRTDRRARVHITRREAPPVVTSRNCHRIRTRFAPTLNTHTFIHTLALK